VDSIFNYRRTIAVVCSTVLLIGVVGCGSDDPGTGDGASASEPTATVTSATEPTATVTSATEPTATVTSATEPTATVTSSCVAAAEAFLADYDSLPTELGDEFTPLSSPPPSSGKVVRLNIGAVPVDAEAGLTVAESAEAIGWTYEPISYDGSLPDLISKFEQAIDGEPDIIIYSGVPPTALSDVLARAADEGIVVVATAVVEQPEPSASSGYAGQVTGLADWELWGEINAYMFMRDSACQGNVATFTLPLPVVQASANKFKAVVEANCPDCKVSIQDIQLKDVGSPAATGAMVSALQADPTITHVNPLIADVATGLDVALAQAGITDVSTFGVVMNDIALNSLKEGNNGWWLVGSPFLVGYATFHAGLTVLDTGHAYVTPVLPVAIFTANNVTDDMTSNMTWPRDAQDQFKALWPQPHN
jgi:ABC-type sugar transport system substrate-binding protein